MKNRDVSHARANLSGFTLVELMVTVAVVAILMAIGAPQLRSFLLKQQAAADINSLSTAIRQARSEALKRSGPVSVCAMPTNFDPAAPSCATNSDWSKGWMVFIDYGTAGTFDPGDQKLRLEQRTRPATINYSYSSITVQANGLLQGFNNSTFYLSPNGMSTPTDDPLCRCLKVSTLSRLSSGTCSVQSGKPKCN